MFLRLVPAHYYTANEPVSKCSPKYCTAAAAARRGNFNAGGGTFIIVEQY